MMMTSTDLLYTVAIQALTARRDAKRNMVAAGKLSRAQQEASKNVAIGILDCRRSFTIYKKSGVVLQ